MLTTQGCFPYCWVKFAQSQGLFCLTPPHQQGGWGCTGCWKGAQPGQLTLIDPEAIPDHMVSCSVAETRGKSWPGSHCLGISKFMVSNCFHLPYLVFLGSIHLCSFHYDLFSFQLLNCSQRPSFLIFTLLIHFSPPCWAMWCFAASWGYSTTFCIKSHLMCP